MSVIRPLSSVLRSVRLPLTALLFAAAVTAALAGWSFDTNLTPEGARDLLAAPGFPAPPAGSWLRVRGLSSSMVHDANGAEVVPWSDAKPTSSLMERRAALLALRDRGYKLVAIIQWPTKSWAGGVRPDQPLRRLPLDLREAADRCQRLAAAYGDLIDYWEIENEPDISFVEENPETYSAFQKACYIALTRDVAKPETGRRLGGDGEANLKPEGSSGSDSSVGSGNQFQVSGFKSQVSLRTRVLNAAFALPPGPYFDAWVANDGLRYTDGFNYHYYGYAEDFTGVYRQFEAAVAATLPPTPADTAVFQTSFVPTSEGWQAHVLSRFAANEGDAEANRKLLRSRPLAHEEPALEQHGRWLVSAGTSIQETTDGWEFTIAAPAPGPLRPAMAELPLPAGWSAGTGASLAFEYRAAGAILAKREEVSRKGPDSALPDDRHPSSVVRYPPSHLPPPSYHLPAASTRKLPIFLTEYGYGLLGPESRLTAEGRADQRRWFEAIQPQIAALGIEGAMAFVLTPYLEAKQNEFGLLMSADSGPREEVSGKRQEQESTETKPANNPQFSSASARLPLTPYPLPLPALAGAQWGKFIPSPALIALLDAESRSIKPQTWVVASTPPVPVVLDFVADASLRMAKSRQGYLLNGADAAGRLVLYNFGPVAVTGELTLEGQPWTLTDDTRSRFLQLAPGERRELPVKIRLADAPRFGPQIAKARFVTALPGTIVPQPPSSVVSSPPSVVPSGAPGPITPQVSGLSPQVSPFEVYLRTSNGNLYQTWPRLQAQSSWQWYVEPFASFTPAFFGRAHLPTALSANEPTALVFFFRPTMYPTTYFIRHASVVTFEKQTTDGR